jgi:hypothetical protein
MEKYKDIKLDQLNLSKYFQLDEEFRDSVIAKLEEGKN